MSRTWLGRSQHLQDLVPALIRLEQNRTAEDCVLVEQLGNVIDVPLFDSGAEPVGEHRRPQPNAAHMPVP